jgi:hypothetical protein
VKLKSASRLVVGCISDPQEGFPWLFMAVLEFQVRELKHRRSWLRTDTTATPIADTQTHTQASSDSREVEIDYRDEFQKNFNEFCNIL